MTDCPDPDDPDSADNYSADAPNGTDNDDVSTDSKNSNINLENAIPPPKTPTKHPFKNISDAPNGDSKIAADDDAADAPNTADNDAGSTDSKNTHIY